MIKEEIKKELEKEGIKGRKEMARKYKKIVKKHHLKKEIKERLIFEFMNLIGLLSVPVIIILLDVLINR